MFRYVRPSLAYRLRSVGHIFGLVYTVVGWWLGCVEVRAPPHLPEYAHTVASNAQRLAEYSRIAIATGTKVRMHTSTVLRRYTNLYPISNIVGHSVALASPAEGHHPIHSHRRRRSTSSRPLICVSLLSS